MFVQEQQAIDEHGVFDERAQQRLQCEQAAHAVPNGSELALDRFQLLVREACLQTKPMTVHTITIS